MKFGTSTGSGDMTRAVYDSDQDGKVNAAEQADNAQNANSAASANQASKVQGVDAAGNSKYYGTDPDGNAGFHSLPTGGGGGTGESGSVFDVRQLTERDGQWQDPVGNQAERTWDNPTVFFSTSDPAVLPPLSQARGMREDLDKYDRYETATSPSALLVVGDPTSLTVADVAVRQRLQDLGFTVDTADGASAPPDPAGYALAVISESIGSNVFHNDWGSSTLPVLCGEAGALDTLLMLDADASASLDSETATDLLFSQDHPAIGDYENLDVVAVHSSLEIYQHVAQAGFPSGVDSLATPPDDATRSVVAVAPAGASMTTGSSPARRAFYGFMFNADTWNDNGKILFDSLAYWVAGWDY